MYPDRFPSLSLFISFSLFLSLSRSLSCSLCIFFCLSLSASVTSRISATFPFVPARGLRVYCLGVYPSGVRLPLSTSSTQHGRWV
uniref:Putative secreted peptide n=1 Tax=Anopheles braziliensis TaxID=58242 RepID=A0A2M3ZSK0_9DIPT